MKRILIDGDMIVHQTLHSCLKSVMWENHLYTIHCDLNEAIIDFDSRIHDLVTRALDHWNVHGNYRIYICLSHLEGNFRKRLSSSYKSNRKKAKPLCYVPLREYIKESYTTLEEYGLEADDLIGVHTRQKDIVISGDKDMRSIPCYLFDFVRGEYLEISEKDANYHHLFQTLVGDVADGYKGCPSVGEKTAEKILSVSCSWDTVVNVYKKNGLTEEDALLNARLAFILRYRYFNPKKKIIRLWEPNTKSVTKLEVMELQE